MVDKTLMLILFDEIIEETLKLEENVIVMNKFN